MCPIIDFMPVGVKGTLLRKLPLSLSWVAAQLMKTGLEAKGRDKPIGGLGPEIKDPGSGKPGSAGREVLRSFDRRRDEAFETSSNPLGYTLIIVWLI
jgi:hypothetical protein